MFEPSPLGLRGGHRSDRHGVIERDPALALSGPLLDVSLSLLAALPNALYLEYMPWFEPLYGQRLLLDGEGKAVVPIAPGWGASFDPAGIARHSVA
jgi:hypothetical protein